MVEIIRNHYIKTLYVLNRILIVQLNIYTQTHTLTLRMHIGEYDATYSCFLNEYLYHPLIIYTIDLTG